MTEELNFIRLSDMRLIPSEYFKDTGFSEKQIERIYKLGPVITSNPLTMIFAAVNPAGRIKGLLWSRIDAIMANIFVYALAIDKEYQSTRQEIIKKAAKFLMELELGDEVEKKIIFETTHPKAYSRAGAREIKTVMELDYESVYNTKNSTDK